MILRNVLLVVKDIKGSRRFYEDILGLSVTADLGEKVLFAGGLVLEESGPWEDALNRPAVYGGNDAELYFEDSCVRSIRKRLEDSDFETVFLEEEGEELSEIVRFYDPDRHIIEGCRAVRVEEALLLNDTGAGSYPAPVL